MTSSSSIRRRLHQLGAVTTVLAIAAAGAARADIFDSLAALADSLDQWSDNPPAAWIAPADTLDLGALFPGARLEANDARREISIRQPLYLQMLRSELAMDEDAWHAGDPAAGWRLPPSEAETESDPALLLWLRTCGLPANLAAAPPAGQEPVELVLQGPDPRRWTLPLRSAGLILSHLTQGSQVYAGPLKDTSPDATVDNEYYLLWTHPEVSMHHFLIWTQRPAPDHDQLVLVPFIPTDNLADLFATTPERQPLFRVQRP